MDRGKQRRAGSCVRRPPWAGGGTRGIRLLLALLACALPTLLGAQAPGDTVEVVAGEQYAAGDLERRLLGRSYRELWTAPVRVPVLDPDTLGGLVPTGLGGGNQTTSLQLLGGDRREYRFRLVDKTPGRSWPEDVRNTVFHDIYQDQISSLNPAGALVVDRLLDAAGILHAEPRLFVLPDHPFLGEHRARFAGTLGILEERPDENQGGASAFAGAAEVEGTEDFFEALEDDPRQRLDAREYLAARLLDVLVGDWDRHGDQWRWARFDLPGGGAVWRPVPRDRDYALADYDGVALRLLSRFFPQANPFRGDYRGAVPGLVLNAGPLDRRLLGELDAAEWEAVARRLQGRLTDPVIDEAVARLPAEYEALVGEELRRTLRERRERLPEAASAFYARLAVAPTVHATDQDEVVRIERMEGGALAVRIWAGAEAAGKPYFERVFLPGETREVRVYLHGGDDLAIVEGEGSPIGVRVIGGGGGDRFVDRGRGALTAFYDAEGENEFVPGAETVVDRREYDGPDPGLQYDPDPPRDWGSEFSPFSPVVDWRPFADLVVGAGPAWTRYGYRRHPWASIQTVKALWAPLHPTRFGVQYQGRFRWTGSDVLTTLFARATTIEATAFYGFGNATEEVEDGDDAVVWERQLLFRPGVRIPLKRGPLLSLGAEVRHTDPSPEAGGPAGRLGPFGASAFTTAGARAALEVERVDAPFPERGFRAEVEGAGYPFVLADGGERADAFARAEANGSLYLSPVPGGPTLALRAGGEKLWGEFPFQYAAFVGGSRTLRGYPWQRFAGDASAYGTLELRQPLTRARLLVRGDLGVFALADAGRVWDDGESEGDWHTALGGGIFFHTLGRTVRLTVARGSETRVYLQLGEAF